MLKLESDFRAWLFDIIVVLVLIPLMYYRKKKLEPNNRNNLFVFYMKELKIDNQKFSWFDFPLILTFFGCMIYSFINLSAVLYDCFSIFIING